MGSMHARATQTFLVPSIDFGHGRIDPPRDGRRDGRLRAAVEAAEPAFLADLERLVNTDCGSYTKAGVDAVGHWTGNRLRALGATVSNEPNTLGLGETVIGELAGHRPRRPDPPVHRPHGHGLRPGHRG